MPRAIKPVSVRVNKEVQRASIDDLLTEEQEITANMNSLFRLLGNLTVSVLYMGSKFKQFSGMFKACLLRQLRHINSSKR